MRVLAFTKYDALAASTRQRFIQYEPALSEVGISVDYQPLLGNDHLQRLVLGKRSSIRHTGAAYLRRMLRLMGARNYDLLWVHCELFPYLPGGFERMAFLAGKPILFDFDDAIFHMYDDAMARPLVRTLLSGKLEPLLRGASACCCGNAYLQNYAKSFCEHSIVLPTVVDTEVYRPRSQPAVRTPVIGWIGSPSTWSYVRPLLPLLRELAEEHGITIRVVGAGVGAAADVFPGLELIEWKEENEVADVQAMDIGIMPLPATPWARGKSGYKLIQYMACGLPVVGSPVGVNSEIVQEGRNGYLASSPAEWKSALVRLLTDGSLRERLGSAGRQRAVERYSLAVHGPRLAQLMRSLATSGQSAESKR